MKSEYEKGMLDMTKQMESLRKEMEAVSRKANQAVTASQRKWGDYLPKYLGEIQTKER
jgi:hypothetical protein